MHKLPEIEDLSAPLVKGFNIDFDVGDDGLIVFKGKINPRHYKNKATHQIWTALYTSARILVKAWEKHENE